MTWTPVGKADGLVDNECVPVLIDGKELALYRVGDAYFATSNVCTHQYALMSDGYCEDGVAECPLHQARFDIRTGEVLNGPACKPLLVYAVKLEGNDILLEH